MRPWRRHFCSVTILLLLLLSSLPAVTFAQSAGKKTPSPAALLPSEEAVRATRQQIDLLQKSVDANPDLDESAKSQILELIQQARADLKSTEAYETTLKSLDSRLGKVGEERADIEKKLSQTAEPSKIAPGRELTDLETERVETEQKVSEWKQSLEQPTVDPAARTTRRKSSRLLQAELPSQVADVETKLATSAPEDESAFLTQARLIAQQAKIRQYKARLSAVQKELTVFDAEDAVNLPAMQREWLTRNLNTAQKKLELLNREINRQRQAEAERRAQEAALAALHAQPLLKSILEESQEIAHSEQELRAIHEEDKKLLNAADVQLVALQDDFRKARQLDKDVGLSQMGMWLRKEREKLESSFSTVGQLRQKTDHVEEAEFALYQRKDELDELADIDDVADRLVQQAATTGRTDLDAFREDAIRALRSQAINLQKLVDEYENYTVTLSEMVAKEKVLDGKTSEFVAFLDERILWVRSHLPLSVETLREDGHTALRLVSPEGWVMAGKSLGWDLADHRLLYLAVGIIVCYLLFTRLQHGKRLSLAATHAEKRTEMSLTPTIRAVVLTFSLSAVWPGLMLFAVWRLSESSISPPALVIAAKNLTQLAGVFLLLEFVRQSIRPQGLAESHFGGNTRTLKHIRRVLRALMIVGLPLAAAVACLHHQETGGRRDVIERLLFSAAMLVLAFFLHRLTHPVRGALRQLRAFQSGGWIDRLDYVWYVLAVGVPLTLAGLAVAGYYDTAVRLTLTLQKTAWVLIGGLFVHAVLSRSLMLRHRRIRIHQAKERLIAASKEEIATGEQSEHGAPLPEPQEDEDDLETMSLQSRRLVTTTIGVLCLVGLWFVWGDVLPAVRFLDRWPVWETSTQVMETITDSDGQTSIKPSYEVRAITIANLIQVGVLIFLMSTAARNLPGLLEISILNRLPIDRSTTYAITSLMRYGIIVLGIILVSRALGIGWSKVQWLAAALTFGLGFGLQEIFANFVSGIIILFEQPVRVGDVVTIDGVSGVVNRIRIRATTIVDWDRKEYIVPNREFITGRLLNWTLSDKTNRVVINVGVGYDSDPKEVRRVIMQVLADHENVLADPPPLVTFEAFGDSSLDFVVRAYLPNLDNRLQTVHDIHTAIHGQLAAHNIEIPFPQRDLNVRSNVSIDVLSTQTPTQSPDYAKGAASTTVSPTVNPPESHV